MKKRKVSKTQLAKKRNLQTNEIHNALVEKGYVSGTSKESVLTDEGIKVGGEYKVSEKAGQYIIWPEDLHLSDAPKNIATQTTKSTKEIAHELSLSARKLYRIFEELGWVDKHEVKGWTITEYGKKLGGIELQHNKTGQPYVKWPEAIIKIKALTDTVKLLTGDPVLTDRPNNNRTEVLTNFRNKFPAEFRCFDGHMVRSKAEMHIDNWLYMNEKVHAYEKRLPIEEEVYCDFYLPEKKVYIEYWGYENNKKYLERKKKKLEIYADYNFSLIELNDDDVKNLDDVFPKLLLPKGIQPY